MVILSFKTKKDKEHLLATAKKMEEYASMIVDCIEESEDFEHEFGYHERAYRHHEEPEYEERNRYGYRRRMR